jgi:hypothetical protein
MVSGVRKILAEQVTVGRLAVQVDGRLATTIAR